MRITLIGYGKMGQTVERVARAQGHQIIHVVGAEENRGPNGFHGDWIEQTEVLIDFSLPGAALANIENACRTGLPLVEGTTGWYGHLSHARQFVESREGSVLYSSNFSLGVQALFFLTREAARLMSRFPDFRPFLWEAHHVRKQDAPSGTALTLDEILEQCYGEEIPVSSLRAGHIPGTHVVGFDSPFDTLRLEHTARSREGFARGALFAAQWITKRKGFYSLEEVIFGENRT